MNAQRKRVVLWSAIGLAVLVAVAATFRPRPLPVDLTEVAAGPLHLTVRDEGETRVVDVFVLSAPITGRLRRVEVEPGDRVTRGETVIAEIEPTDPDLLDPRSEAEARAQLSAADSAAALARAELEKAQAEVDFARSEIERSRQLARDGTLSLRDLEEDETALRGRVAALAAAQANVQVRDYELKRVRAQLLSPEELRQRRENCGAPDAQPRVKAVRKVEGDVHACAELCACDCARKEKRRRGLASLVVE